MSRPTVDTPDLSKLTNGDAPVVNLDQIMGPRVAVRKVILAGQEYRFKPLSLASAKLLQEGETEAAFRVLMAEDAEVVDRFLADAPARYLDEILTAIYSEDVVGEVKPGRRGSSPAAGKSKRSKPTSSPSDTPSPNS